MSKQKTIEVQINSTPADSLTPQEESALFYTLFLVVGISASAGVL
jgi:hypothetical protein